MLEEIEEVCANLQGPLFSKLESLGGGEVVVEDSGETDCAGTGRRSELSSRSVCEGQRVELCCRSSGTPADVC